MTTHDEERDEERHFLGRDEDRRELEAGEYVYCLDCRGWYDDTYCWPNDHHHHCGHKLLPPGDAWVLGSTMVVVCGGQNPRWGRELRMFHHSDGAFQLTADPNAVQR